MNTYLCEFSLGNEVFTVTVEARNRPAAKKAAWRDCKAWMGTDYHRIILRSIRLVTL